MEHLTTETYISIGTLMTLLGILKPMWDANKQLENRLTRMEGDLKHLETKQNDVDRDFEKLSKKLDLMETKINKIEGSLIRIETLLSTNSKNILHPQKTP